MASAVQITHIFNGDNSASDFVDAALLDTQFANLANTLNQEIATRQISISDQGRINNSIVRYTSLHPEVIAALQGIIPGQDVQVVAQTNIAALSGTPIIDGYQTVIGDRVLLVGQTAQVQNGIYVVAAGAWAIAYDSAVTFVQYQCWAVLNGASGAGTVWMVYTLGTTGSVASTFIPILGFAALLPITRGGTGANNAAQALINLGITSVAVAQVATIALLRLVTTPTTTLLYQTSGYYAGGDQGQSLYWWNAADTTADDGFSVIQITGVSTGRFNLINLGTWNVRQAGAKGDGTTDDTASIQAVINKASISPVRRILFPGGIFKIIAGLQISVNNMTFIGEAGDRNSNGGTELAFYGSSAALIQLGTDDHNPWNSPEYNGFQGFCARDMSWRCYTLNANLLWSAGAQQYGSGCYGLRDWRGGSITLERVLIERFQYNFFGVQSDINTFIDVTSTYSSIGFYVGPRSDQANFLGCQFTFNDVAVTIDGSNQGKFIGCEFIDNGANAGLYGISILQGSTSPIFDNCWFEHFAGYAGSDGAGFIGLGVSSGYGSNVAPVYNPRFLNCYIATTTNGNAYHMKYFIEAALAFDAMVINPQLYGGSFNIDKLVSIIGSGTPSTMSITAEVGDSFANLISSLFVNNGSGTAAWYWKVYGFSQTFLGNNLGRLNIQCSLGGGAVSAGADQLRIEQGGIVGAVFIEAPNVPTYQTTRLLLKQVIQDATAMPTTGSWQIGDFIRNISPVQAGAGGSMYIIIGWVRLTTGSGNVLNTDWFQCRCLTGN